MKILSLVSLLFILSCGTKTTEQAPLVATAQTIAIVTGTTNTEQDFSASIEGKTNVDIRPQIEGILERVYVDEGTFVKAGQPLFKINDRPFREIINNAEASLHAAEANILNAQIEIDKLKPLVANKVISEVQLNAAKAGYAVAKANASQAKAILGQARINLGYTTITAPVNGYIGRIPKKQGSRVSATDQEALTTLSDVHEIYAYFSLSETDFIHFKSNYTGNSIEEKLKNLPPVSLILADNTVYPAEGKIDMINGQFDKSTGAITVRAIFPNEDGLIRSGNTGKVRLFQHHDNAILVPQSSTFEVQDKVFVFLVGKDSKLVKQPIHVIGKSGDNYLVSEGVEDGNVIVYNGLGNLQEGTLIKSEPVHPQLAEKITLK